MAKVKVMANCRKKPRQIVELSGEVEAEGLDRDPLTFEFKKEGIVVGKVKVMANCRKKPRQIVEDFARNSNEHIWHIVSLNVIGGPWTELTGYNQAIFHYLYICIIRSISYL